MEEKQSRDEREDWRECGREYRDERRARRYEYWSWRDPIGGVVFGLMIVCLGLAFYFKHTGVIPASNWWAYMLAGFGGIWILGGLVRLLVPRWSYRALGMLIPGIIVGAVGMMFIIGSFQFWPFILIAAGLAVIVVVIIRAIWRSSRKEE